MSVAFLRFCGMDTKKLAPRAPRYDKTMPQIYEDEDLRVLFASLKDPYQRLVFELLLKTGMRDQEAMHVEWTDISTTAKTLHLRAKLKYGFKLKDCEERAMPLPDELVALLASYRKAHQGRERWLLEKPVQKPVQPQELVFPEPPPADAPVPPKKPIQPGKPKSPFGQKQGTTGEEPCDWDESQVN